MTLNNKTLNTFSKINTQLNTQFLHSSSVLNNICSCAETVKQQINAQREAFNKINHNFL